MILTYTGKLIDPFNVKPENICIEDIAHGLSLLCRYNGQCHRFYSVAEHCIIMATHSKFKKWNPLVMLLHDAAEAYIGDMIRPIKGDLPQFKQFENNFMVAITHKLTNKSLSIFATVEKPDNIMLATEASQMTKAPNKYYEKEFDLPDILIDKSIQFYYFTPQEAEKRFLVLYNKLKGN